MIFCCYLPVCRYEVLCDMVDNLVSNAMYLNSMLGMPEREADLPEDPSEFLFNKSSCNDLLVWP